MRNNGVVLSWIVLLAVGVAVSGPAQAGENASSRVQVNADSDARAIEIARSVMDKMGGQANWDATRILRWTFFGGRVHHWDRRTGDIRIEGPRGDDSYLWLMNVNTMKGRVWKNGDEIVDAGELEAALGSGHEIWINDSYWLVMPYKLLDPGVTLKYGGEGTLEDGRAADILKLTFGEGIGYTPNNAYDVFVARDTGLVEQWAFYRNASDPEPGFTMPWQNWSRYGKILLSDGRGRDKAWKIAVYETLPRSVFENPEPVPQ